MEKMPYRAEDEGSGAALAVADWRIELPVLRGTRVMLREVEPRDAPVLASLITFEEVTRSLGLAPPATSEAFERFIRWARQERAAGRFVCFGIVPVNRPAAVGLIQLRALEPGFASAEWGFVLAAPFWGTGLFLEAAQLALAFAFETLRLHRLEARAAVGNARGNAVLRKLGAVQEGVLRRAVQRDGQYHDQVLWSILDEQWRQRRSAALS
jgi:RimJ/RimL family protein N-acetyltransferase